MSEQDAIDKAQSAVGDADRISAAAWLLPRGFSGGMMAGGAIGGDNAVGAAVGAVAGALLEHHHDQHTLAASGGAGKMPENALVAVSESKIYCWAETLDGIHRAAGRELFSYARADAQVTVHGRLNVQTFEVIDSTSGAKWEFESSRIDGHLGPVLAALGLKG